MMNKKKPGEITNPQLVAKIIDQGKLEQLYPLQWFRNRTKSKKGPHVSSIHLARIIRDYFKPESCLDLGAGSCSFANTLHELDVKTVAVEASAFNKEFAKCKFVAHNLCKPLFLKKSFDIVTSWDVIEHIPAKYEKVIVLTVLRHTKNFAILSIDASKWGRYHVNCHSKGYWVKTFESTGKLEFKKEMTRRLAQIILEDSRITSKWYARNLLIFEKV